VSLRYLLDTNAVSAPVVKVPDRRIVEQLERYGAVCAIAAPVWHELTYGCRRLPAGKRRVALEAYLEDVVRPSFPILPYTKRPPPGTARSVRDWKGSAGPLHTSMDRLPRSPTCMIWCW
jgi:tRNA(fMet)-specific endonuclease VapC